MATTLRVLRLSQGLTVEQLATKADVHPDTVHDLETASGRKPRPGTMKKLADALGVPIMDVAEFTAFVAPSPSS